MNEDLQFEGKKYISSRRAALERGYTQDYVGQLIRSKKIDARKVGRSWFVSVDSLAAYQQSAELFSSKHKNLFTSSKPQNIPELSVIRDSVNAAKVPQAVESLKYLPDERSLLPVLNKKSVSVKEEVEPVPKASHIKARALLHVSESKVFPKVMSILGGKLAAGIVTTGILIAIVASNSFAHMSAVRELLKGSYAASMLETSNLASVASSQAISNEGIAELDDSESSSVGSFAGSIIDMATSAIASAVDAVRFAASGLFEGTTIASIVTGERVPLSEIGSHIYKTVEVALDSAKGMIAGVFGSSEEIASEAGESFVAIKSEEVGGAILALEERAESTSSAAGSAAPSDVSVTVPVQNTYVTVAGVTLEQVDQRIAESRLLDQSFSILFQASDRNLRNIRNARDDVQTEFAASTIRSSEIRDSQITNSSVQATTLSAATGDIANLSFITASGTSALLTYATTSNLAISDSIKLDSSVPVDTINRLYANGTDLYWAGNLVSGSAVGNWASDGTSVWRASGNVGVGTTSPYAKLSIAGDVVADYFYATSTSATSTFAGGIAGPNNFVIQQGSGRVGIGTATPSYALDVAGDINLTGNLKVNGSNAVFSNWTTTGSDIYRMSTVGIGTASPLSSTVLHVRSTTAATANDGIIRADSTATSGSNYGVVSSVTGSGADLNVGVFVSATSATQNRGIEIYGIPTGTDNYSLYSNSPAKSYFDGSVGIGTTSPSALLSVSGSQPAAAATAEAAGFAAFIKGGKGGNTTTNIASGGAGGGLHFEGGQGGANTAGGSMGFGGTGGKIVLVGGKGGDQTGSVTNFGGNGGNVEISGGLSGSGGSTRGGNVLINGGQGTNSLLPGYVAIANSYGNVSVGPHSVLPPFYQLSVRSTGTIDPFDVASSSGDTYFHVAAEGNVGIGTTSPFAKLSIEGSAYVSGNLTATGTLALTGTSGSSSGIVFGGDTQLYRSQGGSVMVNNPTGDSALRLSSTGTENGRFETNGGNLLMTSVTGGLVFRTGGLSTRVVITSAGNVGIGTSSPYAKLSVVGPVAAEYFSATSTNATSTFAGNVAIGGASSMAASSTALTVKSGEAGKATGIYIDAWGGTSATTTGLSINGNPSGGSRKLVGIDNVLDGYYDTTKIGVHNQFTSLPYANAVSVGVDNYLAGVEGGTFYGIRNLVPSGPSGFWWDTVNIYGLYNDLGMGTSNATNNTYGTYSIGHTYTGGTKTFYGNYVTSASDSTGGTQYGVYVDLTPGTATKYAGIFNGGNVGIGTTTPIAPLSVVGSSLNGNVYERGVAGFYYNSSAGVGGLSAYKARGTVSSPTIVQNGDGLGGVALGGFDGANYQTTAFVYALANGTPVSGSIPSDVVISTGGNNSNLFERFRVTSRGSAGIGSIINSTVVVSNQGGSENSIALFDERTAASGVGGSVSFAGYSNGAASAARYGLISGSKENGTAGNTAGGLHFYTNDAGGVNSLAERLTITSTGNVGIGTSTPFAVLAVNPVAGAASNQFAVGSSTGTSFIISNSGNVGIGLSNPTHALTMGSGKQIKFQDELGDKIYLWGSAYKLAIENQTFVFDGVTYSFRNGGSEIANLTAGDASFKGSSVGGTVYLGLRNSASNATDNAARLTLSPHSGYTNVNSPYVQAYNTGNNAGLSFGTFGGSLTEKMRIDPSGNVGIGTTSPSARLHVYSSDTQAAIINSTASETYMTIQNGGTAKAYVGYAGTNGFFSNTSAGLKMKVVDNFYLGTNGGTTAHLTVNTAGNVGIGTTSPEAGLSIQGSSSWGLLHLIDTGSNNDPAIAFRSASDTNGGAGMWLIGKNIGLSSNQFSIYGNGANRLTIDTSGNVGIGTTSPRAKLQVTEGASGAQLSNNYDSLFVENSGTGGITIGTPSSASGFLAFADPGNSIAGYLGYDHTNDSMSLGTAGSTRLTVNSSGNVGVGTTSPEARFTVASSGNNTFTSRIYNAGGDGQGLQIEAGDGSGTNPLLSIINIGGTSRFEVEEGGNVGIGTTTPNGKLTVVASTLYGNDSGSLAFSIADATEPQETLKLGVDRTLGTNGSGFIQSVRQTVGYTPLLLNAQGGNVGIGTTTPRSKLDVFSGSVSTVSPALTIEGSLGAVNAGHSIDFLGASSQAASNNAYARIAGVTDSLGSGGVLSFYTATSLGSASSERMRIDRSGNVGIGTTTMLGKLDVNGAIYAYPGNSEAQVHVKNNVSDVYLFNSFSGNSFGLYDGTALQHRMMYDRTANTWGFYTGASERMRIDSSGNVGIGTSSPMAKLSIGSGQLVIPDGDSVSPSLAFGSSASTGISYVPVLEGGPGINFITGGTRRATIGGDGFLLRGNDKVVLDGLTNDGFNWIVADSAGAYGPAEGIALGVNGGNFSIVDGEIGTSYLSMRQGKVGIGTTTPNEKLDVYGNVRALAATEGSGYFGRDANGTHIFSFVRGSNNLAVSAFDGIGFSTGATGGPSTSYKMYITSGGNVGIGTTSPYAKLAVVGEAVARNFTATSTTATSTFAGGFDVGNGAIRYDFSSGATSIDNLELGNMTFEADSGVITWTDLPVTSASALGVVNSYTAALNGNPLLSVYGKSDGAGGVTNLGVGIGTTSPTVKLHISDTTSGFIRVESTNADQNAGLQLKNDARQWQLYVNGGDADKFVIRDSSQPADRFVIDISGNVGIGTTSPQRPLHVYRSTDGAPVRFEDSNGYCEIDPTSTSWTCTSDRSLKKDITNLSAEDTMSRIGQLNAVSFRWNKDSETDALRYGFIAQDVEAVFPELVVTADNGLKSVMYGGFTPFLVEAVKELKLSIDTINGRLDAVEGRLLALEMFAEMNNGFASSSATTTASTTEATVASWLSSMGVTIANAVTTFVSIVVDTFSANFAVVNDLTVQNVNAAAVAATELRVGTSTNAAAAGITILDRATGQPFCFFIINGTMQSQAGECSVPTSVTPTPSNGGSSGSSSSGENQNQNPEPATGGETSTERGSTESSTPVTSEGTGGSGAETSTETSAENPSEPATETGSEPAQEQVSEPAAETVSEPVSEPAPEPAQEASPEPAAAESSAPATTE